MSVHWGGRGFGHVSRNSNPLGATMSLDFTTGALDSRITFTRASTATYVNSSGVITTALSGAARFGYDPATLAPLGLLIEEARTNLVLWSQDFSNAAWVVAHGASKTAAPAITDPMGTNTAYEIAFGATGGLLDSAGDMEQNIAYVSGTVYATTWYIRAKTGTTTVRVANYTGGATSIGSADLTVTTAWTRLTNIVTAVNTATGGISLRNNLAGNSANVYVAAVQTEATSTNYPGPTSYIPTTSATVTRAADVALMTSTNFSSWYNQGAGTLFVQATPAGDYSQIAYPLLVNSSGGVNVAGILRSNSTVTGNGKRHLGVTTDAAGTTQSQISSPADNTGAAFKAAIAYTLNDVAFALDGSLIGTDASASQPVPTQLGIGQREGNLLWFNGHIGSIKYYNQRLSNAQLQALTT